MDTPKLNGVEENNKYFANKFFWGGIPKDGKLCSLVSYV